MPVFQFFSLRWRIYIADTRKAVFALFAIALMSFRFLPFISVLLGLVRLFRAKNEPSFDGLRNHFPLVLEGEAGIIRRIGFPVSVQGRGPVELFRLVVQHERSFDKTVDM